MQQLFMLTHLTGEKSRSDRTAVIQGMEIRRRTLIITLTAFVVSALPVTLLIITSGPWAIILFPLVMIGANLFFNSYRRDGLRLRHWQHARDKAWSATARDTFYLCFTPVDERAMAFSRVVPSSVPVSSMTRPEMAEPAKDLDLTDL